MTKIYLAGSCASEHRTIMKTLAEDIRETSQNVDLYCPFELKIENAWDYSQEEWAQKVFKADLEALNNADIVIIISQGRMSSAGTNWEQGYAYGIGKKVFVVQITDEPTSLMSFCGCTGFFNCPTKNDYSEVKHLIFDIIRKPELYSIKGCTTILT